MIGLRKSFLVAGMSVATCLMAVASATTEAEQTMDKIVALVKTLDGASAAKMYVAGMRGCFEKAIENFQQFSQDVGINQLKEESFKERSFEAFMNNVMNSEFHLKSSVCQMVFDNDVCSALAIAANKSFTGMQRDLQWYDNTKNNQEQVQEALQALKIAVDKFLTAVKEILSKRYNVVWD